MNKLKLLYDVARTMKDRAEFRGTLTAKVQKEEKALLAFQGDFMKNLSTGHSRFKTLLEADHCGKSFRHEGLTECTSPESCGSLHAKFRQHMQGRHAGSRCCGIRSGFSKLAAAFAILSALQVNEKGDQTLITLELHDLPEEFQTCLHEKLRCASECACCDRHGLAEELKNLSDADFQLEIAVNGKNEIQRITLKGAAVQNAGESSEAALTARAELTLDL